MNSEELEQSLHAEFESCLKDVLTEMKQEVSEFQEKIESEFEKHKSHLSELFQDFSNKIAEEKGFDASFTESVTEHLKLARDEGAKITAAAIAKAEEMDEKDEAPANFADIRDAINEISTRDSQSEILKSLVHHASQHTPRGAFFIVKNKHLVGWRVFGNEKHPNPDIVREVYFPESTKTSLSESVEVLGTVKNSFGTYKDDSLYLEKLGYGEPSDMYSIPLVARGRGVAVLYADSGTGGGSVNVEALETITRVAGLTVEVLASNLVSATVVQAEPEFQEGSTGVGAGEEFPEVYPDMFEESATQSDSFEVSSKDEYQSEEPGTYDFSLSESDVVDTQNSDPVYNDSVATPSFEKGSAISSEAEAGSDFQMGESDSFGQFDQTSEINAGFGNEQESVHFDESSRFESPVTDLGFETKTESTSFSTSTEISGFETQTEDVGFDTPNDASGFDTSQFDIPADQSSEVPANSFELPAETVESEADEIVPETVPASGGRTRFGDRNVDLPIEVAEGERRYHNDARRFARLLVSEIKLYNEQKVKEGRESSDLYERLREAIDRSREMYDKRVQPPVAAKFDYFNYELVNTLAAGDENSLGTGYPGASVSNHI